MRAVSLRELGISVDWDHQIGQGAFGAAYRGERWGEPVVVKVCAEETAAIEAKILRRLPPRNPDLPRFVDAGRAVDLPPRVSRAIRRSLQTAPGAPIGVVVMEDAGWEISPALRERCRRDYRAAITVLIGILRGLRGQHRQGILHLDLHDGNIRFRSNDARWAKVIDFSCAEEMENGASATVEGWGWGPFTSHIAPERRGFGPKVVRRSADIFAATQLAVGLMNGGQAFELPEKLTPKGWREAIIQGPILPEHLPEPLKQVLRDALRFNPDRRYQFVAPLMKALRPYGLPPEEGGFGDAYFRDL